jgi:hypothetical protein
LYLTPSVRLLGARRSLLSLVTHLDPSRWRPVVCAQFEGDLSEALSERGIPFEVVKLGWWRKAKYFLWRPFAIARLTALIRRLGADMVHCNEIYPNPYAVRAVANLRAESGPRVPVLTHMRLSITPRMIHNYDLARADRIVVPSKRAGEDFDIWPDKEARVKVIHNGVDLSEFRRVRARAEARRQIGLPPEGTLMMALGHVGPRKGGDTILHAMRSIAGEHPDVRLVFVGNPHRGQEKYAREVRRLSTVPELAGRVHFLPFDRHVLPYYEAADINLLVSREEGFGRTLIEAAAMGVPSIGSRVGGIPEIVEDEITGLLVEPEDREGLARAMGRLLASPALRESMGEAAFRRVAQHFSIKSHAEKIMDLYDELQVKV